MAKRVSDHLLSAEARAELSRRKRESMDVTITPLTMALGARPEDLPSSDELLEQLMERGDGWIRTTANMSDAHMYVFYKFKIGPWAGRYVVAMVRKGQFRLALELLQQKLALVDARQLTPSKDRDDRYAPKN